MRSLTKPSTWFLLIGFLHMPAKDGSASYPDSLGFLKKLKNELKRLYSLEHQAFLIHLGAFHASKSGEVYLMFRLDSNKVSYIMSEISRHSSRSLEVLAGHILTGALFTEKESCFDFPLECPLCSSKGLSFVLSLSHFVSCFRPEAQANTNKNTCEDVLLHMILNLGKILFPTLQ